MRRDPRVPLWDVEQAGTDIECFIKDMDRDAWLQDRRTQAAVERKFEIIGEALNRLQEAIPKLMP